MVVLALRFMLKYHLFLYEHYYEEVEAYRVYWQTKDEYGFHTTIHLFQAKVEDYDPEAEEWFVAQDQLWVKLAELVCSSGKGIINEVIMPAVAPYKGYVYMDGQSGVRRILEEAAFASPATHSHHPIRHVGHTTSVLRNSDGVVTYLNFMLKGEYDHLVSDIELSVDFPYRGW
jgi:hypothetical protein